EATNLSMGVIGIRTAGDELADKSLMPVFIEYTRAVINCLVKIELRSSYTSVEQIDSSFSALEQDYQHLKEQLLRSGATGNIGPRDLDHLLDLLSLLHRVLERHLKALRMLIPLLEERELLEPR
ncbi:MAG: hypothetical protein OEZ05_13530, partial [Nitrospirota bacterium]|nr:hypothetical protein [Nitrospirota bacterium]